MKENPNIVVTNSLSGSGFLSGFIESSVEKPDDGLNGDCIVHYAGKHSKFEMTVKLVNGVREGKTVIVNDGMPYLRLEYKQGSLTGVVERMSESGSVELRGHLVSGVESGFFEEYDSRDQVVWRGYYRNGVRDSKSRLVRKGKDSVRSIEEGEFYECDENGMVTQLCLYENGLRSRVIASYVGAVMTELDENGKRVYEGGFKGDVENDFVRDGFGKEYIIAEEKVKFVSDPRIEIEKKRFLYWMREIEHEVPEMEYVSTIYREKPVAFGHWKNGKKNGVMCDLDEDGKVLRGCWYEDGEMKRVVEEWELSLMILSMRIDNCLTDYMKSASLFVTDISTGSMHGSFQSNNRYFSVDWLENDSQSIMVDMDSEEMIAYRNGERVDTQCAEEVIDLDVNGRRWEGGVKDGVPYGYGIIYDEEGRKEYEGFMMDGMKTCYGIEYCSDIGRVEYKGGYYDNKRFGI